MSPTASPFPPNEKYYNPQWVAMWAPCGFRCGWKWAPGGLRVGSVWALRALPCGLEWAPGGLCVGSVRSPMRFGVGARLVPRGLHALSCTDWSGGMQFWGGLMWVAVWGRSSLG